MGSFVMNWGFITILTFLGIFRRPEIFVNGQFGAPQVLLNNPDTTNIPVWVFQEQGYASEDSTATYNGTITTPLASFTMCFRIQIMYERPRMYVFTYAVSDESANELYAEYHLGRRAFRGCKKGTKFCGWHRDMPGFYQWRHICVTYDAIKDQYKTYADGEKVESGSWSDNPHLVEPNGVAILGQDQDNFGGGFDRRQSFSGYMTQFNVWDFALEDYAIENIAQCRSDNWGNVFASKLESFDLGPGFITTTTMPLFQLCESSESEDKKYFMFNDVWSYGFYKSWCYNMGGSIALPESSEHFHTQMDIAENLVQEQHEKCVHSSGSLMYWIGYTDQYEEGVWMNPYSKEPIAFEGNWEPGNPNGGAAENCARTYIDRKWQDKDCSERNCALCYFPDGMNLTMRGLCQSETNLMEGFFDTVYFVYDFLNGKPEWRGLGKSHIYFMPKKLQWKIESFYDDSKYATFAADDTRSYTFYPTGRTTWKINSGICRLSDGEERRLSLTNCVLEDGRTDFTCRDGTCIPINSLCDLTADCPDKTDEKDCEQLVLPDDYRGEKFPIQDSREPIGLYVNVSILAFPEIDTLQSTYLVDFVISMRWIDPRLNYKNLKDVYYLNSLALDVMSRMWIPEMSLPNALQAEGTQVDDGATLFILKLGSRMPDDLSIAREAKVYRGDECPLVMQKEYFILFACDFNLAMYPFDSNVCTLEFEVSGVNKDYVALFIDNTFGGEGAEYGGSKDLLEYTVGDVTIDNLSNETEFYGKVSAKIVFQRKWIYHLITIFIQSILLLAVAYLTFYFRLNNFQDRIMISITCMLIISTIQSSIDKMVPKTSYFKMVDIFLLYSFNVVIVIMAIHTYMDMCIHRHDVTGMIVDKSASRPSSVTKVEPITDSEDNASRVSSAKSAVSSMFSGSEDDETDVDAYAKARRINYYGQIGLVVSFFLFMVVYWSFALNHYFNEIRFLDDDGNKLEEPLNWVQ